MKTYTDLKFNYDKDAEDKMKEFEKAAEKIRCLRDQLILLNEKIKETINKKGATK